LLLVMLDETRLFMRIESSSQAPVTPPALAWQEALMWSVLQCPGAQVELAVMVITNAAAAARDACQLVRNLVVQGCRGFKCACDGLVNCPGLLKMLLQISMVRLWLV